MQNFQANQKEENGEIYKLIVSNLNIETRWGK